MLQRKPEYYHNFTCIAGDCPLTCCQEWKIYVDEDTIEKWKHLPLPSDPAKKLDQCISLKDDQTVITLTKDHHCPFLNEKKLCHLVLSHGDDVLSHTCQVFPRQIHKFNTATEYSLVACCPAVVDYFHQEKPIQFLCEPTTESTKSTDADLTEQRLFLLRENMIALVQNPTFSLSRSLSMIFYLLLGIYDCDIWDETTLQDFTDTATLKELSKAIDNIPTNLFESLEECNELFLDLAENYRKEGLYTSFLEPAAKMAETISSNYEDTALLAQYKDFSAACTSYDMLLRNYLSAELFTSVLLPGNDLFHMIVAFQWIGIEYAMLRQALFLRWLSDKEVLSYETFRSYLCVIARMTGYDEADYTDYLENSFESLLWDWGYFALITDFPL